MKKPILLLLLCCLVFGMTAPVSAYWWAKDVNVDDFTNALVSYCNHNDVRNMTGYDFELSNHDFKSHDVVRTPKSLDFRFDCHGAWVMWHFFIPIGRDYNFSGAMHVDNPQDGLKRPYTFNIITTAKGCFKDGFIATGQNWRLDVNKSRFLVFV